MNDTILLSFPPRGKLAGAAIASWHMAMRASLALTLCTAPPYHDPRTIRFTSMEA
jgi:hypothetical protein